MANVSTWTPSRSNGSPPSAPDGAAPVRRSVASRRALPSGRAVAGGLLVAVAAVGIFSAYRGAADDPSASFLVARSDLEIGTTLSTSDLELRPVDLPPALAARAYTDVDDLVGGVTVAPLADGDLIQASSVSDSDGPAGASAVRQLSFGVDADRALNGHLEPGERVDVIVTYSSGSEAYTEVVVAGAAVVESDEGDGGALRTSGRIVLTLALPEGSDVLALAHAVRVGDVTVVRTTGTPAADGPGAYRPAAPVGDEGGEKPDEG